MAAETHDPSGTSRNAILDAALPHVPFDGWSAATLRRAAADSGVPEALARALFPRGGGDLAMAFHRRGDEELARRLATEDLSGMRFRDRIAHAVRLRIEIAGDKELVRRGATLFALPMHAADGAKALWNTADTIWTALGDTQRDFSWWTKRATLSGVHAATVLFWLGDDSTGNLATWEFLDRRIEDVMRFEKVKAGFRDNPLSKAMGEGPMKGFRSIRMPKWPEVPPDLPGRFGR